MKYRIYIDEVGNNDLQSSDSPNHRYLCLTGVIVELEYVRKILTPEMERFKEKFFGLHHPDDPIIFHRKELVNRKYPFSDLKNPEIEKRFNTELLENLRRWEYKVIAVTIDKKEHRLKYNTWRYDPYHYAMAIVFERFHLRLKEINKFGDMMFESRGGKEDRRLKESYQRIFSEGTDYIRCEDINHTLTSRELKIKSKQSNISGLQLADLLAYPASKYILKHYNLQQEERSSFSDQIIEILKEKFYKRGNKIDGYGIKLLP